MNNNPWIIWGLSTIFYFFDYIIRILPSIIHKPFQYEFKLNEVKFSIVTVSFYIPYIIMQIPSGIIIDKFSTRKILFITSMITALGCIIMGISNNLIFSLVGRILIGFSASFTFISSLRLAKIWFPLNMLGLLSGITQSFGMLGAAIGEVPILYILSKIGWRHGMVCFSVFFIILSILLYEFIKDFPEKRNLCITYKSYSNILENLNIIISNRQIWLNALCAGFLFAPTAVIGEFIGPIYLQYGRNFSDKTSSFIISLIFIAWGIGGPIFGWISDKIKKRKLIITFSAVSGIILTSIIIFFPRINKTITYILFFAFGFTNIGISISYAIASENCSSNIIGLTISFTNMISILIGTILQPIIGYIIDTISNNRSNNIENLFLSDFQIGLQILPICSLIALILSLGINENYKNIN